MLVPATAEDLRRNADITVIKTAPDEDEEEDKGNGTTKTGDGKW